MTAWAAFLGRLPAVWAGWKSEPAHRITGFSLPPVSPWAGWATAGQGGKRAEVEIKNNGPPES